MGYFPNGTSNEIYLNEYCSECEHDKDPDKICPVMELHLKYNYQECNNEKSFLHFLIPIDEGGTGNLECRLFLPKFKFDRRRAER